MIPTPHLSLPIPALAETLHNKLHQIKVGVQAVVERTDARVEEARAEVTAALEIERVGREQEAQARANAEKELGE